MSARTFVCRCEDVTLHDLEYVYSLGLVSTEELKRYTGLGTGPCQGKECMIHALRFLASKMGPNPTIAAFTQRPPTEPVTFGALAALARKPQS